MPFSRSATAIIQERASWRTYLPDPLPADARARLEAAIAAAPAPPFGSTVRLFLVDAPDLEGRGIKLGTYGVIRGARVYLVGAVQPEGRYWEDFGWRFEWAVLAATDVGLQTCWLGGTLTRESFGAAIDVRPGDLIPAASPVGLAREKRSLVDHTLRFFAKATARKPWDTLFFSKTWGTALPEADAGRWQPLLDAVRRAPSASNRQPWRMIVDGDRVHLYLERTPGYRGLTAPDLQRVDMGIAMCHLSVVAEEKGVPGAWRFEDPGITVPEGIAYTATWG